MAQDTACHGDVLAELADHTREDCAAMSTDEQHAKPITLWKKQIGSITVTATQRGNVIAIDASTILSARTFFLELEAGDAFAHVGNEHTERVLRMLREAVEQLHNEMHS